jgi:3-oxoadipate enol-lactonase
VDLHPRAHDDGTVAAIVEEALAFPHKQSTEDLLRFLDAFYAHGDTSGRLTAVTAPTLVLAGSLDLTARPELGRVVADAIPGAVFEIQDGESHQPFQEVPDVWNARVDAFWQAVDARPAVPPRPRAATADTVPAAGQSTSPSPPSTSSVWPVA